MAVTDTPSAETFSPSLPADLLPDEEREPTEVLVPEGRRRARHRRQIALAVIVVVLGATGVGLAATSTNKVASTAPPTITSPTPRLATVVGPHVTPKWPEALAIGANGDLYAVDVGRDQILERLANGRFKVVAGDGKNGFAGDGGPAIDAQLRLGPSSGIAVARDGTVYFSDTGNDRVRAISRNGDIETVAGGGNGALPESTGEQVGARSATLGGPAGLTFSSNNELVIAAGFIVRLTSAGQLAWVAGTNRREPAVCSATTCAMREQNFDNADGLAFDGAGDLVVTSGHFPGVGWGIAEVRTNGSLVEFGSCRDEVGKPGAITSARQGSVICAAQTGVFRIANHSESQTLLPGAAAGGDRPSPLSAALGSRGPFFGGDGIAVGRTGAIYLDTSPNASATPYAIVEMRSNGSVVTLWKS